MSNPAENIKPGTVIADRYRVVRQLGRGGMGSVFLVEHVHTDEQLALKILHSAVISDAVALERFRREARTPARINSDHVVRVTDADVAANLNGAPFLVMEYLRGEDLDQRIERLGPLPPTDVVLYLRQAARALDKAHALGIVHRDLKPENLFLTTREDGTPCIKILDFGIAKLTGEASRELVRAAATTTGQIFGTPLFMSPEQAKGESSKICGQTDVWALGLIAHRLLTGRDIWTAETITHLIAQIAYEPMPIPSEHGAPFGHDYDDWFAVCCARDVKVRYASAGEAVTALAKSLGVIETFPGPGSGPDRITGRFIIDAKHLTPPPSTAAAATLSASQLTLLGEPPPTDPAPPPTLTPQETQRKSSAGPLTLTGMKLGTAPSRKNRVLRAAAVALLVGASLGGAMLWFMRPPPVSTDDPSMRPASPDVKTTASAYPPTVVPMNDAQHTVMNPTPSPSPTLANTQIADAGVSDAAPTATTRPFPHPTTTTTYPFKGTVGPRNNKSFDPLSGRH
ncbi:serine/threonine protein kinase [Polyangium jinanense]|uniref:Serine/threonine protein kinase n=1 Tax=Polyangium jinanense TaxID=2829994 RepID=A0A9X3X3L5_9BACT|nr:serine/threonine-protein kinase [Polyangium jinanense]MDC3954159.1 serine/threonine protein kinase [Polyangium jinanense]MDC3981885.1 serine/threonine protein kinase [Polyangium jinanense]